MLTKEKILFIIHSFVLTLCLPLALWSAESEAKEVSNPFLNIDLQQNPLECRILYPYNRLVTADTLLVFHWTRVEDADSYLLEISTDSLFSAGSFIYQETLSDTSISLSFSTFQAYFCRLTAINTPTSASYTTSSIQFRLLDPKSITSLKCWYSADKSGGTNNSNLGYWPDISTFGNHAQNINPNQMPVYLDNRLGGKPSVRFDGINDHLISGVPSNSNVFDVFLVSSLGGVSGPYFNGNAGANGYGFYRNDTNFYGALFGGISFIKFGPVVKKGFLIQEMCHIPGQLSYYYNGNKSGNSLSFNPLNANGNAYLGATTPTATYKGEICELLLYDQNLSTDNKSLITKYLHDKYSPPPIQFKKAVIVSDIDHPVILKVDSLYPKLLWSTGDTNASIVISSTSWIKLNAVDIFDVSSMDSVYVYIHPTFPSLKDTIVCYGDSVELNADIGNNYSYAWKKEGSDTLSINPNLFVKTGGIYQVIIRDTSGFTFSKKINVIEDNFAQLISLGSDIQLCSEQTIGLLTTPPGQLSYLWSTGSTDPRISIDESGNYSILITDHHNCTARDTIYITVSGIAPGIDFLTPNTCFGSPANFHGIVISSDSITEWHWNFGDNTTSTDRLIDHVYSEPGDYSVQLDVTALSGCPNSISKTISVFPLPRISLSLDSTCIGVEYYFEPSIQSYPFDTITGWLWYFGDNTASSTINTHTYNAVNTYAVEVIVSTHTGCTQSATDSIKIISNSVYPGAFQALYPFDYQITSDTALLFKWSASKNALNYTLQIATDSLFTNQSIINNYTTSDTFLFCSYMANPVLYWRVIAFNICRDTSVSNYLHLKVFDPTEISGLKAWYSADKIQGNLGSSVESWTDASGNNFTAQNTSSSQQPMLESSSLNNKPTLVFDGVNDFLLTPALLDSTEFDLIAVSTLGQKVGPFYLGNANNDGFGLYRNDTNAYGALFGGVSFLTFGNDLRKGFQVQEITRNEVQTQYFVNNKSNGFSSVVIPNAPHSGGFIGAVNSSLTFKGNLSELLCFDHSLNENERTNVFKYLHDKYCPPPVKLGPDRISNYSLCSSTFTLNNDYKKYLWSNGDTMKFTQSHETGWLKVTVTDIFEVSSRDSVFIQYPVRALRDTMICIGDTVFYNAWVQKGYSFQWESSSQGIFSNDSAIYLYNAGKYWVKITDSLGCYLIDTITLKVDSFAVQANLGGNSISLCQGDYLGLMSGSELVTDYLWNDGSTEPEILIEHAGIYTVTVTNSLGCTLTDSISVSLHGLVPVAQFSAGDSICLGGQMLFTDLSHPAPQDTSASIIAWHWNFGDSSAVQVQNPSHLFEYPGLHNVTLSVTTDSGCVSAVTQGVYLYPLPHSNFLTTNGCTGTAVPFADHSYYPVGKGQSWDWDFGDPASGILNHSVDSADAHVYSIVGDYTVRLIVTSSTSCKDTIYRIVHILESPELDFSFSKACVGDTTQFSNTTVLPPWSPILNSEWDFGDGSPVSREAHPKHIYSSAGNFYVTLTIQTMQCKISKTSLVVVDATPIASAGATDLCQGTTAIFNDMSTVSNGNIVQWYWDLGILGVSNLQDVSLNFPETGTYSIKHAVVSDKGCLSDTIYYSVEVFPKPSADYSYSVDLSNNQYLVSFTDESSTDVVHWSWDFGDGGTSAVQDPIHLYDHSGFFQVYQRVQTVHGCESEHSELLQLLSPVIDLGIAEVHHYVDNTSVQFSADLVNLGTRDINSFDILLSLDGIPAIKEQWIGNLKPDSILKYSFNASALFAASKPPYYYCIKVALDDGLQDLNSSNNEICRAFNNAFTFPDPYPNPATNELQVNFILPENNTVTLEVINSLGQTVLSLNDLELGKGLQQFKIITSDLDSGVYTLLLIIDGNINIKRFIKL